MSTLQTLWHDSAANVSYESFDGLDEVLRGAPDAKVAWLRTDSGGDGVLYAGMFTAEPSTFVYRFAGDETFYVLDGELEVSLGDGERVALKPGDIASFPKGAGSTWTLHSPFRKFFVISG